MGEKLTPQPLGPQSRVFVIDDDTQALRAFERILRIQGFAVDTFRSAAEFLERPPNDVPSCLILDLHLPDVDGLKLQEAMRRASVRMPIVFISGDADVASTASAMRHGAIDFLEKPVDDVTLVDAVSRALEQDASDRRRHDNVSKAREMLERLTPREREVCELVARGLRNKLIASALGASVRTVKIHRARMMHKLNAASVADVVRLVARLESSGSISVHPSPRKRSDSDRP
jgi:FixJ family two-component response regulator